MLQGQIEKYAGSQELADVNNLLKMIFVFCNDKLMYEERL
jgi:hypothetical protein